MSSKFMYRAHRVDQTPDGATYHAYIPDPYEPHEPLFSSVEDAQRALDDLARWPPLREGAKTVILEIVAERPPSNYDDGKIRTVTMDGKRYKWSSDGQYVTVFDEFGSPLLRYSGDPHDRTPSGVRSAIREMIPR